MNELEGLYRSVIMDHYKNPRNKGLKGYASYHLNNPSCGDEITIEADIRKDVIHEINHEGTGCSICCASASIMSEILTGKSTKEVREMIDEFSYVLMGKALSERLEDALVFQGVVNFPARIKCASLPWKALEKIIDGEVDEK